MAGKSAAVLVTTVERTMVLGLKLFFLAVRQVSKPVAGVVKRAAANSENVKGVMAFFIKPEHISSLTKVGQLVDFDFEDRKL